jgi:hypothetical protein
MKKIFLLLTAVSFFVGCNTKKKQNEETFYIPNLDSVYSRIVKNYGEKGTYFPDTKSYAFFKGDPKTPFFHVFYYPGEKKLNIAIYDRLPNGIINSQEITFFKGKQQIPAEYITFGKYYEGEGKFTFSEITQEKVEALLASF